MTSAQTATLFDATDGSTSLHDAFRRVYYHLYSNSDASRAERLFEEIGKLLLVKIAAEIDGLHESVDRFLEGSVTANAGLIPGLQARFPESFGEGDQFTIDDETLRAALRELSGLSIAEAPAAALGEAFQALVGPRMRGDKGQFFTPRALVKCMVEIADPKPSDVVVDPAAGTGGFLAETHVFRTEHYPRRRKFGRMIGLEKDRDIQRLGNAMLQVMTGRVGHIQQANSLDVERIREVDDVWNADIVLTNPPFGAKIGIKDSRTLRHYSFGHSWAFAASENRWIEQRSIRASQDPQVLFLELCFMLLKPGGLLGIVLPEGIFGNKKSGYVWDCIRDHASIEAMIDCPRTTFQPGTDTKTNVLFARKHKGSASSCGSVRIAVAQHCGHDRRGRTTIANGEAVQNDFEPIASSFSSSDSPWWSGAEIDGYYVVPRYHFGRKQNPAKRLADRWGGTIATFGELESDGHLFVRKGHEVGAEAYGSGDIPFVRTSDIHNWEVSLNPTNGVSRDVYERFAPSQMLRAHDILLIVDGRYRIGRTAILHASDTECVIQSHCRIISVDEGSPIDSFELLYILGTREVLEEIRNLVFIQSTLGSIGKRLSELAIPIPERSEEWLQQVGRFREALEVRSQQLTTLRAYDTPDPGL